MLSVLVTHRARDPPFWMKSLSAGLSPVAAQNGAFSVPSACQDSPAYHNAIYFGVIADQDALSRCGWQVVGGGDAG